MFGGVDESKLTENSVLLPKSPYAASKVFSHHMTQIYRDSYNIFGVNGILFNHESPHRGETFVTRKVTRAIGRIYHGIQSKLTLGNLEASRDWDLPETMLRNVSDDAAFCQRTGFLLLVNHIKLENLSKRLF